MLRTTRTLALGATLAAAIGVAIWALPSRPPAPPPSPPPAAAPGPTFAPSAEDRVSYWLDRIVTGPEPTAFLIPDFHQELLLDAIRNLEATPEATLSRLADPALRARVTEQKDANPWFGVLAVLASIGAKKPEVARAWAIPALSSEILTLRRAAVPVLAMLSSDEDAALLLATLARDADDRVLAPACVKALLAKGKPWDGQALRILLEAGIADRPDGESAAWLDVPAALAEVRGGARPDPLAWWALLTEPVAARAKDPSRGAIHAEALSSPRSTSPADAAIGTGRLSAARARVGLMRLGFAGARASVLADAAGSDPDLATLGQEALVQTGEREPRERVRPAAAAWLDERAKGGDSSGESLLVRASEADAFVTALGGDEDPAAALLLERFLRELPPGPRWTPTIQMAYDALLRRGSRPQEIVREWIESADSGSIDRALVVVRHTKDVAFVPFLEAWMDGPKGAARRPEVRRLILLLYTWSLTHGGVDAESLARWAKKVAVWATDRADPSAGGFLGSLVDLGPAGEAQIAEGLAGPDRPAFVAVLQRPVGRYLGADVVSALVAPVGADTPREERRRILAAAFAVSSADGAPALSALARRLRADDRPDAEMVLRIVHHRTTAPR